MDKILTIVVPTYNMERYLENCLNSFIFDENEKRLEVLIVNDGSKDNSLAIAKTYEEKYPNIFKVIDKENGGHGSTINAGLKVATGKYFKVVDSDDWVDTNEFKKLFDALKELDVDCVVNDYNKFFEGSNKTKLVKCCQPGDEGVKDIKDASDFIFYMATTSYKTEKIKDIMIDEKCFYVDVEYNELSVGRCSTYTCLPLAVYNYRIGRVGQSISINGFYKHRLDHKKVVRRIVDNLYNNYSLLLEKDCMGTIVNHYRNYVNAYLLIKDNQLIEELIEFDNYIKEYEDLYNKTNNVKLIKSLRKHEFKNINSFKFVFKCKQFVKKILGMA